MKHPFLIGSLGYPLLEILWRGRTHPSMALAGGLGCTAIDKFASLPGPLTYRAALSALAITGIEAACGLVWNRKYQVWDYRRMPLNWRGQICLPYTLLWGLISAGLLCIDKTDNNH